MHMADALLSPAVGTSFCAVAAGIISYSSRKIKNDLDSSLIPFMGVLGAFVFATQMINFSIPATGSSGHLGGGMLLAILLGPYAAFLSLAAVLTVQALFFADGGLLALGCNIINLAFIPCFIAYPLIFRPIAGAASSANRILFGALLAAVFALQLGSFGVVVQTSVSGIAELPFGKFLLLMQPIHLAIGVIEGLVTAGVVLFVRRARPELLRNDSLIRSDEGLTSQKVLVGFLLAAVICAGLISSFASSAPDGLEWSIQTLAGQEELSSREEQPHSWLANLQHKVAIFADYGLPTTATPKTARDSESPPTSAAARSLAGLVGGAFVLIFTLLSGIFLKRRAQEQAAVERSGH